MSRTSGTKISAQDFYRTPLDAVRPVVAEIAELLAVRPDEARRWLDPGAGDGRLTAAIYEAFPRDDIAAIEQPDANELLDIEGDVVEVLEAAGASTATLVDYLRIDVEWWTRGGQRPRPSIVVCNPPFSLAQRFIDKSLELVGLTEDDALELTDSDAPTKVVAMLVNAHLFGTLQRAEWFGKKWWRRPAAIRWIVPRPSFRKGGTDATAYCWLLWVNRSQLFGRPFMDWYDRTEWRRPLNDPESPIHTRSTVVDTDRLLDDRLSRGVVGEPAPGGLPLVHGINASTTTPGPHSGFDLDV